VGFEANRRGEGQGDHDELGALGVCLLEDEGASRAAGGLVAVDLVAEEEERGEGGIGRKRKCMQTCGRTSKAGG